MTCSTVIPPASFPTTRSTGTRVPAVTGLPKRTLSSTAGGPPDRGFLCARRSAVMMERSGLEQESNAGLLGLMLPALFSPEGKP